MDIHVCTKCTQHTWHTYIYTCATQYITSTQTHYKCYLYLYIHTRHMHPHIHMHPYTQAQIHPYYTPTCTHTTHPNVISRTQTHLPHRCLPCIYPSLLPDTSPDTSVQYMCISHSHTRPLHTYAPLHTQSQIGQMIPGIHSLTHLSLCCFFKFLLSYCTHHCLLAQKYYYLSYQM